MQQQTSAGVLNLSLSALGTYTQTGHEEHCPDINGPGCAAMEVPAQWHDLRLFFGELRLQASYGVTPWLALDLMAAVRVVHIEFALQDLARRPITPPFGEEIHHRTETLAGLSDPWIGLRFSSSIAGRAGWEATLRLGATAPLGATVENPFRLGREGREHQHIQFGTGTVDPWAEGSIQRQLGRFTLGAWALGKATLYENRHGYRAGTMLMGGARLSSGPWRSRWRVQAGALIYHEEPERWDGVVETEGNLGRTDLMLEAAVSCRLRGEVSLSLGAKVPVWSRITGAQLSTPALLELTALWSPQLRR